MQVKRLARTLTCSITVRFSYDISRNSYDISHTERKRNRKTGRKQMFHITGNSCFHVVRLNVDFSYFLVSIFFFFTINMYNFNP